MFDHSMPKTKEEAKKYRYGQWAGNNRGRSYQEGKCAYEIMDQHSGIFSQCSRNAKVGPGGLYCKQHARMVDKQ